MPVYRKVNIVASLAGVGAMPSNRKTCLAARFSHFIPSLVAGKHRYGRSVFHNGSRSGLAISRRLAESTAVLRASDALTGAVTVAGVVAARAAAAGDADIEVPSFIAMFTLAAGVVDARRARCAGGADVVGAEARSALPTLAVFARRTGRAVRAEVAVVSLAVAAAPCAIGVRVAAVVGYRAVQLRIADDALEAVIGDVHWHADVHVACQVHAMKTGIALLVVSAQAVLDSRRAGADEIGVAAAVALKAGLALFGIIARRTDFAVTAAVAPIPLALSGSALAVVIASVTGVPRGALISGRGVGTVPATTLVICSGAHAACAIGLAALAGIAARSVRG